SARPPQARARGHLGLGSRVPSHDGGHQAPQGHLTSSMRSMTGFGVGDAPLGEGRVSVELRALNHRFLEVRVRMPEELLDQSFFVEQMAREKLSRGRFDVGVRLEGAALPPPRVSVERARALYRGLVELRDELSPGSDLGLS